MALTKGRLGELLAVTLDGSNDAHKAMRGQ